MLEDKLSRLLSNSSLALNGLTLRGIGIASLAVAGAGTLFLAATSLSHRGGTAEEAVAVVDVPPQALAPTLPYGPPPPPAAPASTASPDIGSVPVPVPTGRIDIARKLQAGLKEAGCYDGAVNGAWTSRSRQAMQSFLTSINATLPVERAEPAMLALLESHRDARCAVPCTGDGSCSETTAAAPRRGEQEVAETETGSAGEGGMPRADLAEAATGPVPPVGVTDRSDQGRVHKRTARKPNYNPPAFAKSFMRSVQKALSSAF